METALLGLVTPVFFSPIISSRIGIVSPLNDRKEFPPFCGETRAKPFSPRVADCSAGGTGGTSTHRGTRQSSRIDRYYRSTTYRWTICRDYGPKWQGRDHMRVDPRLSRCAYRFTLNRPT